MWPSEQSPERGAFVERQVAALRELGCDVDVAALTDVRTGKLWAALKYWRLARDAKRAIKAHRPDVIHGHYLVPTGSVVRRVAHAAGIPYVVTAHGTDVHNAHTNARMRAATEFVVRDAARV